MHELSKLVYESSIRWWNSDGKNRLGLGFENMNKYVSIDIRTLSWFSAQNQPFRNGICLPKLFLPTVRKKNSSDREILLEFEAEGQEFAKNWDH